MKSAQQVYRQKLASQAGSGMTANRVTSVGPNNKRSKSGAGARQEADLEVEGVLRMLADGKGKQRLVQVS